jgi:hypothetical protein
MVEKIDKKNEVLKEDITTLKNAGRRKAVKTLVGGLTVITAYHTLPVNWSKPVIEQVFLPAHAETSGGTITITGPGIPSSAPPVEPGWPISPSIPGTPSVPQTPGAPQTPQSPQEIAYYVYRGEFSVYGENQFVKVSVCVQILAENHVKVLVQEVGGVCYYSGKGDPAGIITVNLNSGNCPATGAIALKSTGLVTEISVGFSAGNFTGNGTAIQESGVTSC